MKQRNLTLLNKLVEVVNTKIQGIDIVAKVDEERAYGGIIRAAKGKLLEELCKELVKIAWNELGGEEDDLSFPSQKVPIPLKKEYLAKIKSTEVKKWITDNYKDFVFNAQVDVHCFVKDKFALGIECKAYTENAMLKRILVDFTLLKTVYPKMQCILLQLESQLTGDYSQINNKVIYGSHSTHALMSYFDVDLNIMTLLYGERKVDEPIHKPEFFKNLEAKTLVKTVETIGRFLKSFAK
jgi:hypothetical protein